MEASATAEKQTTTYVILERRESETPSEAGERQANYYYVERDQITSRSAPTAIRKYVTANGTEGGVFYAVPIRSWQPTKVAIETQTKLTLS